MIAATPQTAMSATFEQARQFFVQGLAHYEAGRFAAAEKDFAASLALVPGRPSTLTNLGAATLKLGRFAEAAALLDEALAQEPGNVQALGHRATALAELGRLNEALGCCDRALQLDSTRGALWTLRGNLLMEIGRAGEARAAFEQAIDHGADPQLTGYYLASLGAGAAPPTAPRVYVESLFDNYAEGFEKHLMQVLHYRAPEILVAELRRAGRHFKSTLDLGCGTGLCGLAMRPLTDQLHGVDVSGHMVQQAQARGVYDRVLQDDLVTYLDETTERYNLLVAADVFIYVGALEPVFAGAARVMERGAVFCFSVESCGDEDAFVLRPSLRYAHSLGYIRRLAEQYGFEISSTQEHPIRDDQRTPIAGVFTWLIRR